MFKIEELSGSLIKQGRFYEAIPKVMHEIRVAIYLGVVSENECFNPVTGLYARFTHICLNPSDIDKVNKLGNDLLALAIRSSLLEPTPTEEFEKNVKASRETE